MPELHRASNPPFPKTVTARSMKTKAEQTKPAKKPNVRADGSVKRDWPKIKAGFLKSEYVEVCPYMLEVHGIDIRKNGGADRRTKGWAAEKTKLHQEALEKTKQEVAKLYAPSAEELAQMHAGLMTIFKASIQHELERCIKPDAKTGKQKVVSAPRVKEMRPVWEIVKAEKLEPTAVQKNESSLSTEDRALINALLDANLDDDEDE